MKTEELTKERLREVVNYDPDSGIFTRRKTGDRAGCAVLNRGKPGYRQIRVDGRMYKEHRLAFLYMLGRFPIKSQVDHKNRDPWDNRWDNLREATHTENGLNKPPHASRRYKWAYKKGNRWASCVRLNGKHTHIGTFDTPSEASDAAFALAKKFNGDFVER
jgi:HNH endonuclease